MASLSLTQILLIMGSSIVITLLVLVFLIIRDRPWRS